MRSFLLTILILAAQILAAQDTLRLGLSEVLELAKKNHPIIRQAGLQEDLATAELRQARGTLDPKLQSSFDRKELKGTEYYSKFYNSLKIPVWFPIDPKIEAYRNSGTYLGDESFVSPESDFWQWTAGISIPIGKGLFIDERRALIKQAALFGDIAEAEQIKLTNKMLFTIVKDYWEWYYAYEQYALLNQSTAIATEIFRRTLVDYEFGEASVVDTIQSKITLQTRQTDLVNARLDLTQARLALSVHLWGDDDIPLEIDSTTIPDPQDDIWIIPTDSSVNDLITWAMDNHPEIQKLQTKGKQLEVENRWNRESLKPEINLSYSFIDTPISNDGFSSPEFGDNYKLGMDFSFPLLLRKERGKLQKTRVYQESIQFDLQQTKQQIAAEISAAFAELKANQQLTRQYQSLSDNYNQLLQAEIFNLENGESDLFKLNIQQDKYIEAQLKYLKVFVTYNKLKARLPYISGLPFLSYLKMYE